MDKIAFIGLHWTLYEMCLYFLLYSVVGWLVEVCYMTLEAGEFQNRGFLNGPMCPIYGFGVLLVIILLTPIQHRLSVLFLGSMLLCTVLELLVGIFMKKMFHNVWWDYSHERFNLHGYICLKISIAWGLACVLMMRVVQPLIEKLVGMMPVLLGEIIIYVSFAGILLDLVISLSVINKLNLRLKEIDEISKNLRIASEAIGSNLSAEVLDLKAKYDKLISQKRLTQERLIKAFPSMQSLNYSKALETLRQKIKIRKE